MDAKEIIKNHTVIDGNIARLTCSQLDRKLYLEVAKLFNVIGGKWKGGKVQGFVFNTPPNELLKSLTGMESSNPKKDFQFFETPDDLANILVEKANLKKDDRVLEPSAGRGAIIRAIHRLHPEMIVNYCEIMETNLLVLKNMACTYCVCKDVIFLPSYVFVPFDKIIANPPFAKNQDIDHIRVMYDLLSDSGKLVSIASNHWKCSSNKKETEFREWLGEVNADVEEVASGTFKESGTSIGGNIITIKK